MKNLYKFKFAAVLLGIGIICTNARGAAEKSLPFQGDPNQWSDAEIESFLFMAKIQKETNLGAASRFCFVVSPAEEGAQGQVRVISKTGLFDKGKCELQNPFQKEDVETLKTISKSFASYQASINNGSPITAEVIGRTDGQAIKGSVNCALNGSQLVTSNQSLGQIRASYLSDQLKLTELFKEVKSESVTSEKELNGESKLQDCQTWRTAELSFKYRSGAYTGFKKDTWEIPAKKVDAGTQRLLELETVRSAFRTYRDYMADQLSKPEFVQELCQANASSVVLSLKAAVNRSKAVFSAYGLGSAADVFCQSRPIENRACVYECGKLKLKMVVAKKLNIGISSGKDAVLSMGDLRPSFYLNGATLNGKPLEAGDKNTAQLGGALEIALFQDRGIASDWADFTRAVQGRSIEKAYPKCSSLADSKALLENFMGKVSQIKDRQGVTDFFNSIDSNLTAAEASDPKYTAFIDIATRPGGNGAGLSTSMMDCFSVKKALPEVYKSVECVPGSRFTDSTFPYLDADFSCKACGSGIHFDGTGHVHEHKRENPKQETSLPVIDAKSSDPSYASLLLPSIHEIKDCPDCHCTDKAEKISGIIQVKQAGPANLIANKNDNSCYCSLPVAAACGVGPEGVKKEGSSPLRLSVRNLFNPCSGGFVKVDPTKDAAVDMNQSINSWVSGCQAQPAGNVNCAPQKGFEELRSRIQQMTCEKQQFHAPSQDPVADCKTEKAL